MALLKLCFLFVRTGCSPGQFQCDNQKCVDEGRRCDTWDDCGDNSDERGCRKLKKEKPIVELVKKFFTVASECQQGEFRCQDGTCISESLICNGNNDCSDGYDEFDCPTQPTVPYCRSDEFDCGNLDCISRFRVCDGVRDCRDGRDEANCGKLMENHPFKFIFFEIYIKLRD